MNFFKCLLLLCLLSSCATKENESRYHDIKQQMFDLVFNRDKAPTEISGLQLVLIKNGKTVFEHAEGFSSITPSGNKLPLTIDHKVRIASISKFVLTLSLMTLVDNDLVVLDEDISNYLGFTLRNPHFPKRKITVKQVLAHVSSIRDNGQYFLSFGENYQQFFLTNNNENIDDHFSFSENQGPGDYFMYSNLNFGLIAGVIENVSGLRMDTFVKEVLFKPLNLSSSFNVCDLFENGYLQLATLYRKGRGGNFWDSKGAWVPQVDGENVSCFYGGEKYNRSKKPDLSMLKNYQLGSNPTLFSPQGGLRASAKDLAVLMKLFVGKHNENIISKKSLALMLSPVWQYNETLQNGHTGGESSLDNLATKNMNTAYGLSTHIIDLKLWGLTKKSQKYYGHLGSAYGLLGQFWFDPITGDGFIALITGVGDDPAKPLSKTPLDAIEEKVLIMSLNALNHL
ncbi:MAG: serine hydrolase domain-containing protein [Thalassotalea sp.]